ncbi:MAG TPA: hypothetical protein VE287_12225 [Actinopolymorphaceae bacterium]|nr:hypothetical protein [Actinopolymorphaceae bacterium]
MSRIFTETPEYDGLIAERLGRGPSEFEGHEDWDNSEEAREAYARGVAEAKATWREFWGEPSQPAAQRQPNARRERRRRQAG